MARFLHLSPSQRQQNLPPIVLLVVTLVTILSAILLLGTLKTAAAATLRSPFVLDSDTIALYRLKETEGTIVGDATTHAHNGTLNGNGNTWVSGGGLQTASNQPGGFDAVLSFSGQNFTIEGWFKPDSVSGHRYLFIGNGSDGKSLLYVRQQGSFFAWGLFDAGTGEWRELTGGKISVGTLYHVAATAARSGNNITMRLYQDNVMQNSLIAAFTTLPGTISTLKVGRCPWNEGIDYFTGRIEEVCISSTARNDVTDALNPQPINFMNNRVVYAYWTNTPPVLDGKMDDPCWRETELAGDFMKLPAGDLQEKTEVRFAYDASNLYVFWRLHESRMEQFATLALQSRRVSERPDEAAEIQLYPENKKKIWYMLMGSPSGARYEISSLEWTSWNPEWRCVAGRFDGGWTLEEQIPFSMLARMGQIIATPHVGDGWRFQMYRKKTRPREISCWAREEQEPGPDGFLVFQGQDTGKAVPVTNWSNKGDFFSERAGVLSFVIKGEAAQVDGICTVSRNGKVVRKISETAKSSDPKTIEFPYRLLDGGAYRFAVELSSAGRLFYTAQVGKSLPPMNETVEKLVQDVRGAQPIVAGDKHPAFSGIRQRLQELARKVQDTRSRLQTPSSLDAQSIEILSGQIQKQSEEWKFLQADVSLARLYPGRDPKQPALFALGAATESEKIYKDMQYQGSLAETLKLALAGNEYGSFQLAIIPFWQNLKDVSVSFSPLMGPDGRVIQPENMRWFRVDYVKLEPPPPWMKLKNYHTHEPDPLLPAAPFQIPSGTIGVVWIDILMPEGMPQGRYTGLVTVSAGAYSVSRKIEVRSNGFDIPKRSSLETDCWFFPNFGWLSFYGRLDYTPELHAKHAEILGRYRVSSFPGDWTFLCPRVPIYREPDGRFTFDWTVFDKYVRNAVQNNSTAFWIALSCNSGWTAYLNSADTPVIDRASGKRLTIGTFMQKKWDELKETDYTARAYGKAQFDNPVYRDFLVAYVQHLKDLGINGISYYELFDEVNQDPPPHQRWLAMIEHHQFFRKLVPDLRLFFFGSSPTDLIEGRTAAGLVDVWAPHLFRVDDKAVHEGILERRQKYGEKYWVYTCTEKQDKDGNYTPFLLYHRPNVSLRMHFWMAWHFKWDGLLIYALNTDMPKSNAGKSVETRWPNSEWSDDGGMGCGILVYPGPNYELIPSMRLANVRKGLEDYEYFVLLRNEARKLDTTRDAKLLQRVKEALQIDDSIVSSVYKWTKDRTRLETKREQLADLIRAVRQTVSNKGIIHTR